MTKGNQTVASKPKNGVVHREIAVPMDGGDVPSFRLHIDISISGEDSVAIKQVAKALDRKQARLKSGKRCVHVADAVRWMIEQLSET